MPGYPQDTPTKEHTPGSLYRAAQPNRTYTHRLSTPSASIPVGTTDGTASSPFPRARDPLHLPSYLAFGTADGEMKLTLNGLAQVLCEMPTQEEKRTPLLCSTLVLRFFSLI